MCGRFAQYSSLAAIKKLFKITAVTCEAAESYNIAPTQEILAVIQRENRRLGKLHWGLIPHWAKELNTSKGMINARMETATEKNLFKSAVMQRRCLIPSDGFYEWEKIGKTRQPWYFTDPSGEPMGFAGIFNTWKHGTGLKYHSCAILTTEARGVVGEIHTRMPLIISPDAADLWLDHTVREPKRIEEIAREGQISQLNGIRVSTHVNSVRNNDPACIRPLD